ncbi:MFS general substrate transporter [Setomelanomma holmii]|uniref:MFS general substrate transporter n=1 Tax=Setomelanomma holmii TaxID=210430 RepID=A0A9P4LEG8_9PLEO|nr:MFS general substrate transporter [Setomelanomma holmii]
MALTSRYQADGYNCEGIKSLSPIANAPVVPASQDHKGEIEASGHEVPSYSPSGSDKNDLEDNDNIFEQVIQRDGQDVLVRWTKEEERKVVRRADFRFLSLFTLVFIWMAIDRTNVSGVLTSTFLKDTYMTRDQANTGVSLLWFGIVLMEIPSNIVLHRIGPHNWIPVQVIVWGLVEVLQMFVTNASGWYAARLFLGIAESGFIPGALYTLSRWYTQDELTKRSLRLEIQGGLKGWHWIFMICGVSTITTGVLALAFVPKSPHHTNRLFAGLVLVKGWLSEREADIYVARIIRKDPKKASTSSPTVKTWPYLIVCLSGLQSVNGLSTWGATIIESLGFTSIRANLLSAPAPILAAFGGVALATYVDHCKRFGYAIIFAAVWTIAGVIALYHLPVTKKGSWAFYAALFVTGAAPSWQSINVTWLSLNQKSPQRRAIAYAVYIGCSNLGGTYGNQVFRGSDAPLYRKAWVACLALAGVLLAFVIGQTIVFKFANARHAKRHTGVGKDDSETDQLYVDRKGRKYLYYW